MSFCLLTFVNAASADSEAHGSLAITANATVNGWFENDGDVIVASSGGERAVDMVSVVVLGTRSARTKTFAFAAQTDRVTVVFFDDKFNVIARKEISKDSGLVSSAPGTVSWQRRSVGSGQGGSGESIDNLTITCDKAGNLVINVVSTYSIRRFFGLQKEYGTTRGTYAFHRIGELPQDVAHRIGVDVGAQPPKSQPP